MDIRKAKIHMRNLIGILLTFIYLVSNQNILASDIHSPTQSLNYDCVGKIIENADAVDIYYIYIYTNINGYTEMIEIEDYNEKVLFLDQLNQLTISDKVAEDESMIVIDFWKKDESLYKEHIYDSEQGFMNKNNEWIKKFISQSDIENIIKNIGLEWVPNNAGAGPSIQESLHSVTMSPTKNSAIDVKVNGHSVQFDAAPQIINNRTMVSARTMFESFGYTVEWNGDTQTVIVGGLEGITMNIGSTAIRKATDTYICDVAPIIISDRTFIPLRMIAELLGYDVSWDGDNQIVWLSKE